MRDDFDTTKAVVKCTIHRAQLAYDPVTRQNSVGCLCGWVSLQCSSVITLVDLYQWHRANPHQLADDDTEYYVRGYN